MSQNHPHDNIYSILGKLEALKPTTQEKHDANVQQIRESVEAQGSIIKGLREIGSTESRLARQFAESKIEEKAVSQAQQKFMGMVHAAQKGKKAASPEVAKVAKSMGKKDAQDFAATKHKGLPQHVGEEYNRVDDIKQTAKEYMQSNGIQSVHDLEPEDIEYIGGECQCNYSDVCEILGCELPDSLGPVKSYDEHGDLEEGTCNECGMTMESCGCDYTNEGKVTHPEKGVTRHTKTDFPGYPSDDLEKDDDDKDAPKSKGGKGRPRKATTKNPRRDADAPKKGRGRPSKHSTGEKSSSDSLPFSSKNKVGHDLFGRVKSSAHKTVTEGLNLMRMQEEQHMTLDEMISCMQEDMLQFKKTGVCSERLRDMMEVYAHAKKQMEETVDRIAQPQASGIPKPNEFDITAPKAPSTNGIGGKYPPVTKPGQAVNDLTNPFKRTYEEEVDPMEAELNELAELAGLSEVSRGEYIKQQDANAEHSGKNKFNAFGQLFHTDEVDEELEQEGTLFTKGLEDDDVKIGDKIPGTNAIKTKDIDEDKIEVKDAPDAANKPKKKYFSMRASTMSPGEGDNGEKAMNPDRPTFKNGDNALSNPPSRGKEVLKAVAALESKLAAEYESIKKVNK